MDLVIPGLDPKFIAATSVMAVALTQVVKNAFDVPGKIAPAVAVAVSVLCAVLLGAYLRMNLGDAAFHGFVSALVAMGAYSGYAASKEPLRPGEPQTGGGSGDTR